jgi:single-strand DNA-binding protein
MDLNRVTLIGNLTGDPELKKLPAGQSVVRFARATHNRWEDSDKAKRESVEFHDVMAFGKLADIIGEYVKRGSKVYVEGRLRTRTTTGKDGKGRKSTEVVADNLIMLGHRGRRQTPLKTEAA